MNGFLSSYEDSAGKASPNISVWFKAGSPQVKKKKRLFKVSGTVEAADELRCNMPNILSL